MNRKDFLSKSTLGLTGWLLLPSFFASCKRENIFEDSNFKGSVGIVGAGISGLYAALLLKQRGIKVEIFEASDEIGGRIKRLSDFSDFQIDLGPEFIHGQNSIWYDLARNSGLELNVNSLTSFFAHNNNLLSSAAFEALPEYAAFSSLLDSLADYSGSDISALSYAQVSSLPDSMMSAWNSKVANSRGTDSSKIGMTGLAFTESNWQSGDDVLVSNNFDFYHSIEQSFGSLIANVRLNTPIETIGYGGSKVTLQDSDGNIYEKDRVIVTAPLGVLKSQLINFNPNLPPLHLQAINAMSMDKGLRILLKFSQRFWSENMGFIYGGSLVPQYWTPGANGRSNANNVLSCSVNGVYADNLELLGADMIPAILSELDTLFGNNAATTSFVDAHLHNWADEPYIQGVSSFHPPLFSPELRGQLGTPVNNKLFFAGEHTHSEGHHGTVQGALETALRAVNQILLSV